MGEPSAGYASAGYPSEEQLREASRPSVRILERLAEGTSGSVHRMLIEIAKNFTSPGYSVGQLREKLGIHQAQLRRFHAAVGMTPGRLIRECRMETAMRLLRDTPFGVDEIAVLVGYDSKRALQRRCLSWCGLTLSDLRDSLRPLKDALARLPEDVVSWYFWEQYRTNALSDDELNLVIEYLESVAE